MNVDPIGLVMWGRDLLDNVKVYKRRCRSLITRCEILIIGLRGGDGALPAGHQAALNEAEAILESIRGRVLQWTQLSTARSLLMQDAIRNRLDEYERKIDACIMTYHIKIAQHLAQDHEQHFDAAQRDMNEIRAMVQGLLFEFTRYKKDPNLDISHTFPAFQTVIHDIEKETLEAQLHDVVSEENDVRTQSSTLSIDTFHRQMTAFSRSLVNLELVTPYVNRNASGPPGRVRQYSTESPSEHTRNVGYQRSPTSPQLPPLNLGGNFTCSAVDDTTLMKHTPSRLSTQNSWSPSQKRSSLFAWAKLSTRSFSDTESNVDASLRAASESSELSADHSFDVESFSHIGSSSPSLCRNSLIRSPSRTRYTSLCPEIESQQPKRPCIIVNDVASGSQSLRQFSLIVPETVDPGRSLKAIKPETLESMIQDLLAQSAENDNEQRSVFFIAHPAFVSPLHVLRIITQQPIASQARVLHFLDDWLNDEHVIFDDDTLDEMGDYLASVNDPESEELDEKRDELVFEIANRIREKRNRRPPVAPLIVSPSQQTQRVRPAPCDLAIALAVLEGEPYKRIVASEYMACVSGLQPYPNLSAAIGLNQLISKWVLSCILDPGLGDGRDGIKARSKVKQYFVKTAKECRKIRNFSSSSAIINALQSEVIARLPATQGRMSLRTKWTYDDLLGFFGKKSNYQDYRTALKNQQMCSTVPWHVVDLEDIRALMEDDAVTDEEHNLPRIHLERWARLKRRAMSALHYHVPFNAEDARRMKEYLMTELQLVSGENYDHEERSLILKAEEDRIMLENVGFFS